MVDDQEDVRSILKRELELVGHTVTPCGTGEEAVRAVERDGRGVVIADWMMPGMDGLSLCRALRELQQIGALDFCYFILLTARNDTRDVVEAFEAGIDDFIRKPFNTQELLLRAQVGVRMVESRAQMRQSQIDLHKINMEMAVLNRKLDRLANTDALTGVHNRRYLLDHLAEAWKQTVAAGAPLSCCMVDIDHFKKINDRFGHAAGDHVLKIVAKTFKPRIRKTDFFGRIGGEEFCAVMPGVELGQAGFLAERMRAAIVELTVDFEGQRIPVTASMGVAQVTPRHANYESLLAEADRLLYRAKENGRNQVWLALEDGRQEAYLSMLRAAPELVGAPSFDLP